MAAIPQLAKATVSQSSPAVILLRFRSNITPLAAGMEYTSKTANRPSNETPARRYFSFRWKD